MDEELRTAIENIQRLFKERDSPEWWSQNIIDASKGITKKENWTKFYAYMYNPETFDPNLTCETLEDCKEADLSYDGLNLEEVRYENGNETFVHVRVVEEEKQN
jgi:hypothetical protein